MKSCLITGCNGFIGSQLAEFMLKKGFIVYGTSRKNRERINVLNNKIVTFECDVLNKQKLELILSKVKPDVIFHLAAQSKVMASWKDPEITLKINVLGTLSLLEAIKQTCPSSIILVVEAAAVYGSSVDETPITENHKMMPSNPYAVSKVAQDYLAELYRSAYGMKIIRIRPFNITGPGNIGDACSDFAKGIVAIENGDATSLKTGDVDSVRDITDVRDAVEALWLIAEKGVPGSVYNLCSGKGYHIGNLLDELISLSEWKVNVVQDSTKERVLKDRFQIGDNSRLVSLGWQTTVPIRKTLSDMLAYWRNNKLPVSSKNEN